MSAEVSREWTEVESLKTTDFGALVVDLKEIEKQLSDLEERKAAIRKLIVENYRGVLETGSVRVQDRVVSWRPPGETRKLSEKKLILAGVTPDLIARAWDVSPRAGYLEMRTLKDSI